MNFQILPYTVRAGVGHQRKTWRVREASLQPLSLALLIAAFVFIY